MNTTEKPPFDSPSRGRSGEDLDGLFRAFFRAEMPHRWPPCPEPPAATLTVPSLRERPGWTLVRSRLALAASVGLLLAGLWLLSGKFPGTAKPTDSDIRLPSADRPKPFVPAAPMKDDVPEDLDVKMMEGLDVKMMLIQRPDGTSPTVIVSPKVPK